jgi:Flp pilus assembly pilin Flp
MTKAWCRQVSTRLGALRRRFLRETAAQDLIEYALLTGIIAIAGILLFPTIRTKMAAAYQDWNDDVVAIWRTPPPV